MTADKRVLLQFNDGAFLDPFYASQMSDGTLKIFAYLLLMEDPEPPPFICIEEPENGLYHRLLESLARELRAHATGKKDAPQIFVTTHQPYFVDALSPNEVWILEKAKDGFSVIRRASDIELVRNLVEEGLPLGGLWYSDYLDARKACTSKSWLRTAPEPVLWKRCCRRSWENMAIPVEWAEKVGPRMNVEQNRSPSFCKFRDGLRRLTM